nr:hypothetical protein [uncultured Desulfobacter sp.]
MPKIESFEKYSEAYDQWFDKHPDFYAAEIETIRRLIPSAGAEGMEVGVGSGKFAVPHSNKHIVATPPMWKPMWNNGTI